MSLRVCRAPSLNFTRTSPSLNSAAFAVIANAAAATSTRLALILAMIRSPIFLVSTVRGSKFRPIARFCKFDAGELFFNRGLVFQSLATTIFPPMSLTGKVAIVTGSGRGLGAATAIKLAELGADVTVNDVGADG